MSDRIAKLPVGLLYNGQHYREVVLKPLSGRALLNARGKIGDNPNPTLYLDILRATVVGFKENFPGTVPVEQLTWVDADFIFRELAIWESEMTGEPLVIRRQCQECKKIVDFPVDPDQQTIKMVEDTEFGKYPDFQIPFKLATPITTLDPDRTPYSEGRIALLTAGDEIERMRRFANNPGRFWAEGIRLMIVSLGPKGKGDISHADLDQMDAIEIKRLEALYNRNEPGVQQLPIQPCPNCRGDTPIVPPIIWVTDFLLFPQIGRAQQ